VSKPDEQFDDQSDFTVVTEKKRVVMNNYGGSGEMSFGKP